MGCSARRRAAQGGRGVRRDLARAYDFESYRRELYHLLAAYAADVPWPSTSRSTTPWPPNCCPTPTQSAAYGRPQPIDRGWRNRTMPRMPTKELKAKYGKGTQALAINAAIRAELPGGDQMLDALEVAHKAAGREDLPGEARAAISRVLASLLDAKAALEAEIRRRYDMPPRGRARRAAGLTSDQVRNATGGAPWPSNADQEKRSGCRCLSTTLGIRHSVRPTIAAASGPPAYWPAGRISCVSGHSAASRPPSAPVELR